MSKDNDNKETFNFSFRCYFPNDNGPAYSVHYQRLAIADVPKWIESFRFTHPTCISICCKGWFVDNEEQQIAEYHTKKRS